MALKGFSRWLNVHGYLRTDPGARFRTPRLKRVIPLLPPFAELELKLVTEPRVRNRAIIAMALYGGLRAEEIRQGSFIADQGLIGFVGKGSKQRSVALPPHALQIITEYLTSKGAVPRDPLIRKQDGSGGPSATT
jgi:integrase/recombinase XerC